MLTIPLSHLLLVEPAQIALVRERLSQNDVRLMPALAALREAAGRALKTPLLSVTQKIRLAPSGDPHDYLSMGPYWWPDPSSPDGLPYIRRDGEHNPEREQYNSPRLKRMAEAVTTLAWAGYFCAEPAYHDHAARLIRAWFLEDTTRMNSTLNYGQFIPGVCDGRGIGIIDTSTVFPTLLDAIQVLISSSALTVDEGNSLRDWMSDYRDWNIDSANGKEEAVQHNNHGTWYDVQLAALALFTGQGDLAARICSEAVARRIETQIQPDGSQPHELARTRSFSYSIMNLNGFANLAALAKHAGIDLYQSISRDGRGIRPALEWLRPYAAMERPWRSPQITPLDPGELIWLYRRAAAAYREPRFEAVLSAWRTESDSHLVQLLYPLLP